MFLGIHHGFSSAQVVVRATYATGRFNVSHWSGSLGAGYIKPCNTPVLRKYGHKITRLLSSARMYIHNIQYIYEYSIYVKVFCSILLSLCKRKGWYAPFDDPSIETKKTMGRLGVRRSTDTILYGVHARGTWPQDPAQRTCQPFTCKVGFGGIVFARTTGEQVSEWHPAPMQRA